MTTKAETTQSLTAEEIAELRIAMTRASDARNDLQLTTDDVLHWQSRYRYAVEDAAPALLAMASRLVELEQLPNKWRAVGMRLTNIRALPGPDPQSIAYYQAANDLEQALSWTSPTQKPNDGGRDV